MEKKTCKKCDELKLNELFRPGRHTCKSCENKDRYRRNQERRLMDPEYDRMWKEYDVKRKRKLEKDNPLEEFKQTVRSNNRSTFRRKGYKKNSKSYEIYGIDWNGLRLHIENQFIDGMSWDNRGKWEIDHIIPISLAVDINEIIELSHYTNLNPMWSLDNKLKGDKIYLNELSEDIKLRYNKFILRYIQKIN
jgi:hypothetical protein